ncbi:Bug family tripartite tricarboxylate transporter substrate binding protein [Thermodesulfobacteriota bacterium]
MKKTKYLRPFILLILSLWSFGNLLSETSFAAPGDFPKKTITIIINSGPGGGRDTISRGVGNTMKKLLGVPIVIRNLPGAGGIRGLEYLWGSAPDGYTLGVGTPTDILIPLIQKTKYDPKKFIYIANAQYTPDLFLVKSDSPFHSLKDFKTFGKDIRVGTHILASVGTVAYMILGDREGFPISIVAGYPGIVAATLGLTRGETETNDLIPNVAMPYVRAGQVRPILVIGKERHPNFPNIPTVGEIGHPDLAVFALYFWFMAPPEVPKDRIQILEDALMKTLKDPEFLKWANRTGVDIVPLNSQQTTKLVFDAAEVSSKYRKVVEKYIEK